MSLKCLWQQCALPVLTFAVSGSLWAVGPCGTLPSATAPDFQTSLQTFLDNRCYEVSGWQHDPAIRSTNGVHPNVKVWYSPSMWEWMTRGRHSNPPEGGILVKEQYGNTVSPTLLTDWSVMVRDERGAWDGWWWGDLPAPSTP
jgi:hypothetical protein